MRKIFFFIVLMVFSGLIMPSVHAATASNTIDTTNIKLRFSLITCEAGDDLYTIWGHTAIRVVDSINNTDLVYNYGSFDFNTPNFIAKFVKGNLNYFISNNNYQDFLSEYQYEQRNVYEQVLKIPTIEKIKWQQELQHNMLPGNRFYLYNFIYDNCTTRIKDGLFKHAAINEYSIGINSFREQVVTAPYKGGLGWVGLGIDLLLGAVSDQQPTLLQEAFLPKLLFNKIALNPTIVAVTKELKYNTKKSENPIAPITIILLFIALYIFVASWNALFTQRLAKCIDISLMVILGIGGALVFYMSLISIHSACHENYNLIWLHPFYILVIPVYFISKKWTGYLGWIFFTVTVLFMFANYWIPQHFSKSVMAVMAIVLFLQTRLIKRGLDAKFQ